MNMDSSAMFCQPTGCSGMIEVDVRQQDIRHIMHRQVMLSERGAQAFDDIVGVGLRAIYDRPGHTDQRGMLA